MEGSVLHLVPVAEWASLAFFCALWLGYAPIVRLLGSRAFTPAEMTRMKAYLRPDQIQLMDAANDGGPAPLESGDRTRATTHA